MKITHIVIAGSVGILTVVAVSPLQAATAIGVPLTAISVSPAGSWGSTPDATLGDAPYAVDGTTDGNPPTGGESSLAIGHPNATAVFDFGSVTNFSDVSITQRNFYSTGVVSNTPNNFLIQVSASDNPANNDWVTIATASNIFGYNAPSTNNWDAGRRIEFATQSKRYIRYVNTNTTVSDPKITLQQYVSFETLAVGRSVVLTDASSSSYTNPGFGLNYATDSDPTTAYRSGGTSGSINFDALVPTGNGVSSITLQHANAALSGSSFSFPTGTLTVLDSNDPTFATYNSTTFTLSSTEAAGTIYSLNYATPVNSRYFQLQWSNVVTPTATATQFAEIGITTSPIPEPTSISLLSGAGLLLLRRRRRSRDAKGC